MDNNKMVDDKQILNGDQLMVFYKKKNDMFEKIPDKSVYIARDIKKNESYTDFSSCDTYDELSELCKEDHHLYEIIKSDRPRYSYFDIDAKYHAARKIFTDDKYSDEWWIETDIVMLLQNHIKTFKEDNDLPFDDDQFVVLSSTDKTKISVHIIDRTISFKDQEDCKIYHTELIKSFKDNLALSFVDRSVYTSDRNFRLVNQSKFKNNATCLKLDTEDHNIEDTFITNVPHDSKHFIPFKRWKKQRQCVISPIKENISEDEDNEIDLLLTKIDNSRFDDYDSWTKTVWCLFACGCSETKIHRESSTRFPSKYTFEGCEHTIKQYDHEKSKFNISTLRAWAKADTGFEIERILEKKIKIQPKTRKDHYQFLDLVTQYQGKVFQDGLGLEEFCQDVSSCVQMILNSSTTFCVYENDDSQFGLTKKLVDLRFTIRNSETEQEKMWTLQNYMSHNPLSFPLFNKIVFKPNNHGLKRNELNIFSSFVAEEVDVIDYSIVDVFKHHIYNVWADRNDDNYKYIMSWLAQIIKTPHKKTEVAILLQGGMGTGKTLPCDFLYNWVFGKNLSLTASGLQSLTQRFNGSVMGKVFAKVDELSIVSESFNAAFDKMKSLITDRNIQIEQKGLEHIEVDNFINMILTTNHRHTVKLERDDRRYACFSVSDKYKQDDDYFGVFMDTLNNQNAGDHVFTYFLRYREEDMVNLRRIPRTSFRTELLESNKNTIERFVESMDDDHDPKLLYDWKGKHKENAITVSHFYQYYRDWCVNVGEKSWSMKAVASEIKHSNYLSYTARSQINGIQKTYYVFKKND